MARFDKVDPKDGSYRAKLGFGLAAGDVGDVIAVTLDGTGVLQKTGADGTDCRGVICPVNVASVGDPIDVMTDGEIVDVASDGTNGPTPAAGGKFKAIGAGALAPVANATAGREVGWFVENWRLIVRLGRS